MSNRSPLTTEDSKKIKIKKIEIDLPFPHVQFFLSSSIIYLFHQCEFQPPRKIRHTCDCRKRKVCGVSSFEIFQVWPFCNGRYGMPFEQFVPLKRQFQTFAWVRHINYTSKQMRYQWWDPEFQVSESSRVKSSQVHLQHHHCHRRNPKPQTWISSFEALTRHSWGLKSMVY